MEQPPNGDFRHCITHEQILALPANRSLTAHFIANITDRATISTRLQILAVDAFSLHYTIHPRTDAPKSQLYQLECQLRARVQQECVASFAPVPEAINTNFTIIVGTAAAITALLENDTDATLDTAAFDEDGILDIGDIAIQYLALALNPYPRSDIPLAQILAEAGISQQDNVLVSTPDTTNAPRKKPFTQLAQLLEKTST